MPNSRVPTDAGLLEAAARLANLPLSAERAGALLPAVDGVFALLDTLDRRGLGETAPAFGFQAKWGA
jgi:hypothetical protein